MRFPIDIVWLNQDKKVITTKENVAPTTYPESFCPTEAAQYVIEVNAGAVQSAGVTKGQRLQF